MCAYSLLEVHHLKALDLSRSQIGARKYAKMVFQNGSSNGWYDSALLRARLGGKWSIALITVKGLLILYYFL